MTDRGHAKPPGAIRLSSLKWLLALVCPFAALLAETRLNTAILETDLRMGAVNAELKRLQEAQDAYNVKIATLETLVRIEIAAPDLGLVPPQPNQIRTIYYDDRDPLWLPPDDPRAAESAPDNVFSSTGK